jgi:hypothetical protein
LFARSKNSALAGMLAGALCYGESLMTDTNTNPLNLDKDAAYPQPSLRPAPTPAPKAAPMPADAEIDANSQQAFLTELALSGDIQLAAAAAGHANDAAFFKLRQSDVAFAALWDAASDIAYLRLESALLAGALQAATAPVTQPATPADLRVMIIWHRLSLNLLAAHRLIRNKAKGNPVNIVSNAREVFLNKLNLMRSRTESKSANMACTE